MNTLTGAQRYNRRMNKIFDQYKQHRADLEQQALKTVSADWYYALVQDIDSMSDMDLFNLIDCKGDVKKETKLIEGNK